MLRTLICGAVALVLCAGVGLADDKGAKDQKKGTNVNGKVKKVDAVTGTLTITVMKKGEAAMDKEFKIGADVKVVVWAGSEKKEMTAKEGLKSPELKEGQDVGVTLVNDKVTALRIGKAPKKNK
jgi:hypothetical protein